jgi:hypothetical protein
MPAPVKHNRFDALLLRALGDELAHCLGCFRVAPAAYCAFDLRIK